jgi:hypothetical protein
MLLDHLVSVRAASAALQAKRLGGYEVDRQAKLRSAKVSNGEGMHDFTTPLRRRPITEIEWARVKVGPHSISS